jgi:hypothetical protein
MCKWGLSCLQKIESISLFYKYTTNIFSLTLEKISQYIPGYWVSKNFYIIQNLKFLQEFVSNSLLLCRGDLVPLYRGCLCQHEDSWEFWGSNSSSIKLATYSNSVIKYDIYKTGPESISILLPFDPFSLPYVKRL